MTGIGPAEETTMMRILMVSLAATFGALALAGCTQYDEGGMTPVVGVLPEIRRIISRNSPLMWCPKNRQRNNRWNFLHKFHKNRNCRLLCP